MANDVLTAAELHVNITTVSITRAAVLVGRPDWPDAPTLTSAVHVAFSIGKVTLKRNI